MDDGEGRRCSGWREIPWVPTCRETSSSRADDVSADDLGSISSVFSLRLAMPHLELHLPYPCRSVPSLTAVSCLAQRASPRDVPDFPRAVRVAGMLARGGCRRSCRSHFQGPAALLFHNGDMHRLVHDRFSPPSIAVDHIQWRGGAVEKTEQRPRYKYSSFDMPLVPLSPNPHGSSKSMTAW